MSTIIETFARFGAETFTLQPSLTGMPVMSRTYMPAPMLSSPAFCTNIAVRTPPSRAPQAIARASSS